MNGSSLLAEVLAEHRVCAPPYSGCYSHVPSVDHCRACGMAVPCDVMLVGRQLRHLVPPPGTRLVLVATDALGQFGARTERGYAIAAEWGEPDQNGWYAPVFTCRYDQPMPLDAAALERALRTVLREGLEWPTTVPATVADVAASLAEAYAKELAQ